jgi:CheY-like chemotaxis protein
MNQEVRILVAEDDDGHSRLIEKNLQRAGIANPITRFHDGQEALAFLFGEQGRAERAAGQSWLLLLDIRMPKVDGVTVLQQVKADPELRKMPVIMLTTTDDPREVVRCHEIGCSHYITKPVDYQRFVQVIRQLGLFLAVVEIPEVKG